MDEWLHVEPNRMVSNPGGRNRYLFEAGFHFVKTLAEAERYLLKFTRPDELVIAPVRVSENIRPKPRSNDGVYLAQSMCIDSDAWDCILLARDRMKQP
jgi:hypothetical protein